VPARLVGCREMARPAARHALGAAGAALVAAGCLLVAAGGAPGVGASLVVWGLALVSHWVTTLARPRRAPTSGQAPASRPRRG
jgi:hypothetical protein